MDGSPVSDLACGAMCLLRRPLTALASRAAARRSQDIPPDVARDSGVCFHVQPPDVVWPVSVECQIQEGDTGDTLYIVLSGRLRSFSQDLQGREITYAIVGPGQFVAVPGPRFEAARPVKRGEFVSPMVKLIVTMFGE